MAVSVSRDLTVEVLHDGNAVKLTDRQQALHTAIHRGEPKALGVSQVMLGVMVMSYSLPLLFTDVTLVLSVGVPWWSGLMFIVAGSVAIVLDKHCTMKLLQGCLLVTSVSLLLSLLSIIIYSVDMGLNPEVPCVRTNNDSCDEEHYSTRLSRGLKACLLLFTLAQTVISSILCFFLYRQRRGFGLYATLTQAAPPSPTELTAPSVSE
uniref:Membrane-spanning 4-domains subfamily A member 12-like n=2 Tax=Gouania willdenowi TaxID=441366 RepID=A0A8C5D1R2_GOUWI